MIYRNFQKIDILNIKDNEKKLYTSMYRYRTQSSHQKMINGFINCPVDKKKFLRQIQWDDRICIKKE